MKTILRALRRRKFTVLAVVAALTLALASTAMGHTGSAGLFHLNHSNTGTALTTLAANLAAPVVRFDNNGTGPAMNLQVEPGSAPMTVNSSTKVSNLNSDQLDGKSADQLVRVAYFSGPSLEPTGIPGTVAWTTITAPAAGFLVIDGGSDVLNEVGNDNISCWIEVDDQFVSGSGRFIEVNGAQNVNREENCSTNTVHPVSAETYFVDLEVGEVSHPNTRFFGTALSVIYIPFDGAGNPPTAAAISAAQDQEEVGAPARER